MPKPDPPAALLDLGDEVGLARGRAHEVLGPSRAAFALLAAARVAGPVLWVEPSWIGASLSSAGIRRLLDPGRLTFSRAWSVPEMLWAAEEALRTGLVPLVVLDLPDVPGRTAVRRLHLAAATHAPGPVALLLTPGKGGALGVETRWQVAPTPGWAVDGEERWRVTRLRARILPERSWEVRSGPDGALRLATGR